MYEEDYGGFGEYSPVPQESMSLRAANNNERPVTAVPVAAAGIPSQISYADPAAVAAAEQVKARTQAQFLMARNYPRNYDNSRINIMAACRRRTFAEKVEYSKPVGGSSITGPSIRFAELALREWGNIDYSNTVIYEDDLCRRISIVITDLQTNTTFSSTIVVNKTVERKNADGREIISQRLNTWGKPVYIVKAYDDEIMTKQQALISKALRNEGLRLIPQEIIEEAIYIARKTIREGIKADPDAARRKIADAFAALGVMPTDLEKYLGHGLAQCSADEITDLTAVYNAVKNGETKWADFVSEDDDAKSKALSKADALKQKIQSRKAQQQGEAPKKQPVAPVEAKQNAASEQVKQEADFTEQHRILKDNMGEFGIGLNEKEIAARIKNRFNKTLEELTQQEALILNNEIIEEMRNKG